MVNSDKVLIIDDEEDICFLLAGMLRSRGYKTDYANTLKDGYNKLKEQNPSIIFLDLNLPDGSGFSMIPKIRNLFPDAKVAIISAYDGMSERNKAIDEGADFFISKPFNKESINRVLKHSS